jgi:PAS domain S-box-containing protein
MNLPPPNFSLGNVLLLEDRADDALLLVHALRQAGFTFEWQRVETEAAFLAQLRAGPDLILADYNLPEFDGLRALKLMQAHGLDVPFIVITGTIEEMALVCMREGADDYLLKDRLTRLGEAVRRALANRQLRAQKRQAEQDLREREARLRAFTHALPDLTYVVDENGRYSEILNAPRHLPESDPTSLQGRLIHDVYPADIADLLLAHIQQAQQSGELQTVEYQREMGNGRRWYEARLAPVNDMTAAGQQLVIWLERDITARKEAAALRLDNEFLTRQSEELAKLNADKDRFFSIVAHDLMGPFQPVLLNAELLYNFTGHLSEDKVQQLSRRIYDSTQQAVILLENLLQWARVQMGHIQYNPEVVDLTIAFTRNVALLSAVAQTKEVYLVGTLHEPLTVYADPYMVDTILRNLLSNALKFTPKGGSVTLAAKMDADSMVEIRVTDTGVGMSQADLDNLFQLGKPHTTAGVHDERGSGLGLIICAELVQKNQGHLHIESQVGQGTTVRFTLPHAAT